jgi:hypothetical protein
MSLPTEGREVILGVDTHLERSGVTQAKGGRLQQKVGSFYDPDGSFSICFNHRRF